MDVVSISHSKRTWDSIENEGFLDYLDGSLRPNGLYDMPPLRVGVANKYDLFMLSGLPGQCSTVVCHSIQNQLTSQEKATTWYYIVQKFARLMRYTKIMVTVNEIEFVDRLKQLGFYPIHDSFENHRTEYTIWMMMCDVKDG
jgi:hypothetical protein